MWVKEYADLLHDLERFPGRAIDLAISNRLEEDLGGRFDEVLAERFLERLIGRMIDINYHRITESGHPPPKDYDESFLHLGRLDILPPDLARRIAACAGLRNWIVHEYDDIDPARVYEGLQAAVRDVPQYLAGILRYIERLPAQ